MSWCCKGNNKNRFPQQYFSDNQFIRCQDIRRNMFSCPDSLVFPRKRLSL
ncbi:MAG: hypothetical protein J5646_08045 [Bacteroidales bacterium]|nr:hypothetical protein [Bacteroidales bacterium]